MEAERAFQREHFAVRIRSEGAKFFVRVYGISTKYGCRSLQCSMVVSSEAIRSGRIKVTVQESVEPTPTVHAAASPYRSAHHAAAACGLSTHTLSRITGTVLVVMGERNDLPTETQNKVNVGLNLKFNKKNQEVSGYTRRCKLTNAWLYSERCIELVKAYVRQFSDLFDKLIYSMNNDIFFESDLWPDEIGQSKPQEIVKWIKSQPHSTAMRRECGSDALEPEEMKVLFSTLHQQLTQLKSLEKSVTLHVKWNLLYKPELHEGNIQPDPKADFKMYDRVICVARNITVPLGAKGTITAVYQPSDGNTVRLSDKLNAQPTYQVMFDEPFSGAQTEDLFEEARFYRMLPTNMLNISFGRKLRDSVSCAETQPFTYTRPTILRRDDGHNSAFASYSPPREISPGTDNIKNGTQQTRNPPEPNSSWRVKNDTPQTSTPTKAPNWRAHAKNETSYNAVPPSDNNDVASGGYKNQPPMPPYPTFAQPFQGPGPSQSPFPQLNYPRNQFGYQDRNHVPPRNQQSNHSYNSNQSMFSNQPTGNQDNFGNHAFPKHLPNVNPAVTLGPAWIKGQSLRTVENSNPSMPNQSANGEKFNNPFIPLQAQTRRQNSSGTSSRQDLETLPAPNPAPTQSQPMAQQVQKQQQATSKPQRKKKTRIAANLPFQLD
ncbi:jg20768 [Pararge aegeria aegeria]|uniref:Jg20768 protein n=1 Tax=Pararge aegeria aegeria TaxID=348720 RepID=A0A8S4R536_9NEOP|nr:jg20768 [Pararge aegeria aegeria]